jgi:ABC-type Fe3+-siderophore transport system permease subunit
MRKINRALVGVSLAVIGNIIMVLNGSFLIGDGITSVDMISLAGLCLLISCVAWAWTFKRHHFYYVVAGLFSTMMIMWSTFMNFYWVTNGWSYYIFGVALMGTLIVAVNKEEFI